MPLFTLIGRVTDKLMLVESIDSDDEKSQDYDLYREQAKKLIRSLSPNSEPTGILTTAGNNYFLYIIENYICFVTLCENSFPKKLAYAFLDELKREFDIQCGAEATKAKRPYAFQQFDTFIQKTKKLYMDTKSQRNLNKVSADLKDINKIMTKSIHDIINRGAKIDEVGSRSEHLASDASKYEKKAVTLVRLYWWRTYGPLFIGAAILLLLLVKIHFQRN
jgi:vesicle transport protein SEC22